MTLPAYSECGKSCEYLPVLTDENSAENLKGGKMISFVSYSFYSSKQDLIYSCCFKKTNKPQHHHKATLYKPS